MGQIDSFTGLLLGMATFVAVGSWATAPDSQRWRAAVLTLPIFMSGIAAIITRESQPVSGLLIGLALVGAVPLLSQARAVPLAAVQRYVTVVTVGALLLVVASGLLDLYRTGREPHLTRLIVALLAVGWGLTVAAFPFHFWLPSLFRAHPSYATTAMLATARTAAVCVFLGTFAALPSLVSDRQSLEPLLSGGTVAMLAGAALSLTQRRPLARLAYLAAADVGFVLVGLATATPLGLAGAVLATMSHGMAVLLLLASLGLLAASRKAGEAGTGPSKWGWSAGRVATVGIVAGALGLAGVPPTVGFVSRWMIYQAAWPTGGLAFVMLLAAGAVTLLSALQLVRTTDGETGEQIWGPEPVSVRGASGLAILCTVLIVAGGIYPAPLVAVVVDAVSSIAGIGAW